MSQNNMLFIDYPSGRKNLPSTILTTSDIFKDSEDSTKNNENNLYLSFNSICIKKDENIPLLDIGYSPSEKLEMKPIKKKTIYFTLPTFKSIFSINISSDYTCFEAKTFFATKFITVPQNIIINYNDKSLKDNTYLFQLTNSENSPFTITLRNDYQLFYTFFDRFSFVCLHNKSTLRNLKDVISCNHHIFSNLKYGERIKKYFTDLGKEIDENSLLTDLCKDIFIFDFDFDSTKTSNSFFIELIIENENRRMKVGNDFGDPQTAYLFTCYLELIYKIDRSLFVPTNSNGTGIKLDTIINNDNKGKIIFKISAQLRVIINNNILSLPYLTTINDIKEKLKFKDSNFGIIINNHFAYGQNSKSYLINFLNNATNNDDITTIIIKKPNHPCHVYSFKSSKERKRKNFLVPDYFQNRIRQIFNFYLKQNYDSYANIIQQTDEKTNFVYCNYEVSTSRKIKIIFYDDANKSSEITINVKGENPRIIDLLTATKEEKPKPFKKKKHIALGAFLSNKELHPCQPLSDILYDDVNKITVKMCSKDNTKTIDIFDISNNKTKMSIKYDDLSVKEIINTVIKKCNLKNDNYALYLNYVKLKDTDHPLICSKEWHLFINKVENTKILNYSNNSYLKNQIEINEVNYSVASQILIGIFQITDLNGVRFTLKLNDDANNDVNLPSFFDAGVIPNNKEIVVDYKYEKSNRLTISNNGRLSKIEVSNIEKPIKDLKSEIRNKIGKYSFTSNSLYFHFYKKKLDENKRFSDYRIPEDAIINIGAIVVCFKVKIGFPKSSPIEYYAMSSDKIKDIKDLIKMKYNYNEDFDLRAEKDVNLKDDVPLREGMNLSLFFKKKKIKSQGSLGNKDSCLSDILKVSQANSFLKKKLECDSLAVFVYNDDKKFYEIVDPEKSLFEVKSEMFVHKIFNLKSIRFGSIDFQVNITNVSECNTVEWFKKAFLNRIVVNNIREFVLISESGNKLKDKDKIGDSVNEKTSIEFVTESSNVYPKRRKSVVKKPKVVCRRLSDTEDHKESEHTETSKDKTKKEKVKEKERVKEPEPEPEPEPEKVNEDDDDVGVAADVDGGENKSFDEDEFKEIVADDDEESYPYKFQIGSEPVFTLNFKEDATVEDAKIKIAEKNDVDPSCVIILFAGKNLKKSINIKSLELTEDDILYVYIRNIEEVLLMTAKALRTYGRADFEEDENEEEDNFY